MQQEKRRKGGRKGKRWGVEKREGREGKGRTGRIKVSRKSSYGAF